MTNAKTKALLKPQFHQLADSLICQSFIHIPAGLVSYIIIRMFVLE